MACRTSSTKARSRASSASSAAVSFSVAVLPVAMVVASFVGPAFYRGVHNGLLGTLLPCSTLLGFPLLAHEPLGRFHSPERVYCTRLGFRRRPHLDLDRVPLCREAREPHAKLVHRP